MSAIEVGQKHGRTIVFPRTVRRVQEDAFSGRQCLWSVILNEGLEELGGCTADDKRYHGGTFNGTQLQRVTISSTLKVLGDNTFCMCKRLRHVDFEDGSRLRKIGSNCFFASGLEEFEAPPSLREIELSAFYICTSLKRVVLNEGLEVLGDQPDST